MWTKLVAILVNATVLAILAGVFYFLLRREKDKLQMWLNEGVMSEEKNMVRGALAFWSEFLRDDKRMIALCCFLLLQDNYIGAIVALIIVVGVVCLLSWTGLVQKINWESSGKRITWFSITIAVATAFSFLGIRSLADIIVACTICAAGYLLVNSYFRKRF